MVEISQNFVAQNMWTLENLHHSCNGLQYTMKHMIYFVQVMEGPVLCVQRCEAQAKSNFGVKNK